MPRPAGSRSATTPARPALAGALAVATLILGLLGMHALVASPTPTPTHGAGVSDTAAATSAGDGSAAGAASAGHSQHADLRAGPQGSPGVSPSADALLSAPVEQGSSSHGGHDVDGTLMMCLAVLAAALALIGAAPARSTGRPWRAHVTFSHRLMPSGAHAAGPPPAWEFSVIRC